MHLRRRGLGSEQALAPVWLPDTFAEGAWDKVLKTEGTFDFVFPTTIVHGFYKNYIGLFFVQYVSNSDSIFKRFTNSVEMSLFSLHVASQLNTICKYRYLKY